jgi:hypothetical protein
MIFHPLFKELQTTVCRTLRSSRTRSCNSCSRLSTDGVLACSMLLKPAAVPAVDCYYVPLYVFDKLSSFEQGCSMSEPMPSGPVAVTRVRSWMVWSATHT